MKTELWKDYPVIKNLDGTFNIVHLSTSGYHLYNVCPPDLDPANLYNVAEVAAFWESLEDDDPKKQIEILLEPEVEQTDEPVPEPVGEPEESLDEAPVLFCLNTSGTYHRLSCSHAAASGEHLTLEELQDNYPSAKACGTCNPPALTEEIA